MSTALIALESPDRDSGPSRTGQRPNADFIAQLIATAGQAPQTRARRRAEPEAATAAYRALGQWRIPPGGRVARSL